MNVAVTGLAPHNEAAFGVFLSRSMPGWSWRSVPTGAGAVLPAADIYVADMVSLGLPRWSQQGQAELFRLLRGRPGVLLLPSTDATWAAVDTQVAGHSLVWLPKPYGTREMGAALQKAATYVGRPAPRQGKTSDVQAPAGPGTAEPTPAGLAPVSRAPVSRAPVSPAPTSAAPAGAAPVDPAPSLSVQEFQARLAALPEVTGYLFLRQLSAMLTENDPFEVRFTVLNSLIVHPAGEWIATNTPMPVIKRICQSNALASAVSVRKIDASQAEQRVQRLGMPPQELDAFLHDLVAATLAPQP